MGSCHYGAKKSSSASRENQESQRYTSIWIQIPENLGTKSVSPGLSLKTQENRSTYVWGQDKIKVSVQAQKVISPFPHLIQALKGLDDAH